MPMSQEAQEAGDRVQFLLDTMSVAQMLTTIVDLSFALAVINGRLPQWYLDEAGRAALYTEETWPAELARARRVFTNWERENFSDPPGGLLHDPGQADH